MTNNNSKSISGLGYFLFSLKDFLDEIAFDLSSYVDYKKKRNEKGEGEREIWRKYYFEKIEEKYNENHIIHHMYKEDLRFVRLLKLFSGIESYFNNNDDEIIQNTKKKIKQILDVDNINFSLAIARSSNENNDKRDTINTAYLLNYKKIDELEKEINNNFTDEMPCVVKQLKDDPRNFDDGLENFIETWKRYSDIDDTIDFIKNVKNTCFLLSLLWLAAGDLANKGAGEIGKFFNIDDITKTNEKKVAQFINKLEKKLFFESTKQNNHKKLKQLIFTLVRLENQEHSSNDYILLYLNYLSCKKCNSNKSNDQNDNINTQITEVLNLNLLKSFTKKILLEYVIEDK